MSQRSSLIFALIFFLVVGGFGYLLVSGELASLRQTSPQSVLANIPNPSAAAPDSSAAAAVTPQSPAAQPAAASASAQPQTETPTPPSTPTPDPSTAPSSPTQNDPASTASSSSTPDTSSWKDWKSTSFGAEIKYPPDYGVSEDSRDVIFTKGDVTWKIRFYSNKDKSSFQTWYAGYFPAKDNNACNFEAGTLKVGTLSTNKVTLNSAATVAGTSPKCDAIGDYAVSADLSQVVRVYTDKASSDMTTVNQILGTFKFNSGSTGT